MLRLAALDGQVTSWFEAVGPVLFYLIVWGLVFAGTGLFIGVFIPFVTGDSLLFAAGILAATSASLNIWVLAIGVGIAAFLGDQVGFLLGRRFGRPYLDRRRGAWVQRG
ncbi:MAG: DedA family protein, partial [Lacisediminihabitans sp.]